MSEFQIEDLVPREVEAAVEVVRTHSRIDGNLAKKYFDTYHGGRNVRQSERRRAYVAKAGHVIGVVACQPDKYEWEGILWLGWLYVRVGYPLSSTSPNILCSTPMSHDLMIGHRVGDYSLLKQPVEEQTARARSAPVEPKGELIEVVVELSRLHGTLVGAQQPPFQERGDAMDGWHRHVRWTVG